MSKIHHFSTIVSWDGKGSLGTTDYSTYTRNHTILSGSKAPIHGSSDPAFRGDQRRYNPEELLVASASACHMLWYLHLCADSGVVVLEYTDKATSIMIEESNGSGRFQEIMLNPIIMVKEASMVGKAKELHDKAGQMCFIANSCNFPIKHNPTVNVSISKS